MRLDDFNVSSIKTANVCTLLWDRLQVNISRLFQIYHIPLLKLFFFHVKTMRNNSETERNTVLHHICKDKSRHYKWLLLMTKNLFKKNPTNFSSTQVRICGKGRYAPDFYLKSCSSSNQLSFFVRTDNLGACVNQPKGSISP